MVPYVTFTLRFIQKGCGEAAGRQEIVSLLIKKQERNSQPAAVGPDKLAGGSSLLGR